MKAEKIIDDGAYIALCVATLGFAWAIRVVITKAILKANKYEKI